MRGREGGSTVSPSHDLGELTVGEYYAAVPPVDAVKVMGLADQVRDTEDIVRRQEKK